MSDLNAYLLAGILFAFLVFIWEILIHWLKNSS